MKAFVAFAVLVLGACGSPLKGTPSPSSPANNGAYFILPYSAQPTQQHVTAQQVEEVMSQLRQEDGSDSGVYHIVLPDGRLQRVEFTTAPVKSSEQQVAAPVPEPVGPAAIVAHTGKSAITAPSNEHFSQVQEQLSGPASLIAQQSKPAQLKQTPEKINFAPGSGLFLIPQTQQVAELKEESSQFGEEKDSKPAQYVASIQYTDVQPIAGPIYSYNGQPLTRVVRYAPY